MDIRSTSGSPHEHAPAYSISIQDWMQATRGLPTSSFVERAVDLARTLTRYICHIIDNSALPQLLLKDHVRADNVIIYALPLLDNTQSHHHRSAITVTDAKFISLIPIEQGAGEGSAQPAVTAPSDLPSPPAARVALGKLLLCIFSKFACSGKPGTGMASDCSSSKRTHEAGHGNTPEPAEKRHATSTMSSDTSNAISESERARNILISSGMPLSVCQLVGDLLEASGGEPVRAFSSQSLEDMLEADTRPRRCAIGSFQEALQDLSQMKAYPTKFLFDRTCPQQALEDACLFTTDVQLIGREREMSALAISKSNISDHVRVTGDKHANHLAPNQDGNFLCEAFFLSGYAGCGKSTIVQSLTHSCSEDQWFVLGCKFSQQTSPHMVLADAFNGFFGKWGAANRNPNSDLPSEMIRSFNKICTNIFNLMDDEALRHLCYFVPNFARVFPLIDLRSNYPHGDDKVSSMDKVGSGRKRMQNLLHVLLKSICSVGHPVLFTLDDLQWSESDVLDDLSDFIFSYIHDTTGALDASQKGLLVVGTFRSNEVDTEFMDKVSAMEVAGEANVSTITICDFSKEDVNKLLSSKLCLPYRYTRELAHLVHAKTRGNPFFILQFLRSITGNKMLTYSVRYRRWIWDRDVVDMQMISDDVAQLLTTTLDQLPSTLQKTLKIISCLGIQVEEATINALDAKHDILPFNMQEQLPLAVEEGILEKAGPVYQFTHDIIHQTIYGLIPSQNRELLHKTIGMSILNTSSSHTLATDQINIFCKSAIPSDEEGLLFSQSNAKAAKIAIGASSFDQARTYIDMGIQLLDVDHWHTQYQLSLHLFEMSASVSWAQGKLPEVAYILAEILSNAKGFDDTLTASSLSVKLLMASSKFDEAEKKCLRVLKKLGEEFPEEYDVPFVVGELASMDELLRNITVTQMKQLPPMTDRNKLSAMTFLHLLCVCALDHFKPMLLPVLSCRMVKLTMERGFCDDSIVGLANTGVSVQQCTGDFKLSSRIGKVAESLIEQSSKKHMLRSRLSPHLNIHLKCLTEPIQSALQSLPDCYDSAMIVGDVESALICRWCYLIGKLVYAPWDISTSMKSLTMLVRESIKCQQHQITQPAKGLHEVCSYLAKAKATVNALSLDEMHQIREETTSRFIDWQLFLCLIYSYFWREDYVQVAETSRKYDSANPSAPKNRVLEILRKFYEGIACFRLARHTKETMWKTQGEKAMEWMVGNESMCRWNFANKVQLLRAEKHYTEGNLGMAEESYRASIESAGAHYFIHEEALAFELFGIFCVENQMLIKGIKQLRLAREGYEKWGAVAKVDQLREKIDLINKAATCWVAVSATQAVTLVCATSQHAEAKR